MVFKDIKQIKYKCKVHIQHECLNSCFSPQQIILKVNKLCPKIDLTKVDYFGSTLK